MFKVRIGTWLSGRSERRRMLLVKNEIMAMENVEFCTLLKVPYLALWCLNLKVAATEISGRVRPKLRGCLPILMHPHDA